MARFPSQSLLAAALGVGISCSAGGCSDAIERDDQPTRSADAGANEDAQLDGNGGGAAPPFETDSSDGADASADRGVSGLSSAGASDADEPQNDGGPKRSVDAGSFDSGWSYDPCTSVRYRIAALFSSTLSAADRSCRVDDDCTFEVRRASCDEACTPGYFSAQAAASIATGVRVIERDLCPKFVELGCPQPLAACSNEGYEPRCVEGACEAHRVGCPDEVGELEGKSCSEPGKECWNRGWCPPGMVCSDERRPGQLRWEPVILACLVRAP